MKISSKGVGRKERGRKGKGRKGGGRKGNRGGMYIKILKSKVWRFECVVMPPEVLLNVGFFLSCGRLCLDTPVGMTK